MTPHLWQRQSEVSLSFQRKVRSCTFGQECASLINDITTCSVARGRVMFVISDRPGQRLWRDGTVQTGSVSVTSKFKITV